MRSKIGLRFRGLALRLSLIVGVATLVATLFVSAISLHTIRGFLSGKIDKKFSALLWTANEHIQLYYAQRRLEVETFARSRVLTEGLRALSAGGAAHGRALTEVEAYLGFVLESFPQFDSVLVLDREGRRLAGVGGDLDLPKAMARDLASVREAYVTPLHRVGDRDLQMVSVPLLRADGQPVASLHATLDLGEMVARIREQADAGTAELFLIDALGDRIGGGPAAVALQRLDPHAPGEDLELAYVDDDAGQRWVAGAVTTTGYGWTLVVQEPYDAVFAPLRTALRRVGGFNLVAALLASMGSLGVVAWRVRPILDLADGARRISEGETDVRIPEARSSSEIRLVTQAFNQMARRLAEKQAEVADANHRLRSQNEELRRANEVLEQLSITDGLTRLHNHRHFQDQLVREAKRADRTGSPLSLILIDIDDFKQLNDALGHAAGDSVLLRVAQVMSDELRDTDLLARYGGEEFALLAPQTDLGGAIALAEKLRIAVAAAEFSVVGPEGRVRTTVSIGVSEHGGDVAATFDAADRALYEAKAAGKDCVLSAGRATSRS